MFFVPGIIVSVVTFPGVIIHELAHQIFCRLMRVPVYEVKYFQFSNPCGYVLHEATQDPLKTFLISTGPFLINTLIGMIILSPAAIDLIIFEDYSNSLNLLLGWIGFSTLMHAFPSTGDAKVLVNNILKNKNVNVLVKMIVAPVIGLIYVGAIGSVVWLDAIYAAAIAMIIPNLFLLF
ncbi:metalloprotease family protein [Lacrimispora defluvii]|uniref:DUF3267 domain-containing protein n=1 Tax=Lacrimispora defluvii TaxID=2719233 RepID=A0ABX1VMG9_9FIRM|nr:metalloprotease family protein [Lacrimispora defluvii]NNJ29085.1 DUF3267 domain-containing protein [Lacrimispora defluvii]